MLRVCTLAAVLFALAVPTAGAQQKPAPSAPPGDGNADPRVDLERCAQLRDEHIKVLQSGVVQDMQRGPEWAKFHLTKERLGEIEKYLTLEEQLKFNCREANLLIDPKSLLPAAAPANAAGSDASTPAGAGASKAKGKKVRKKKNPEKPADAAGTGADLVWPGLAP